MSEVNEAGEIDMYLPVECSEVELGRVLQVIGPLNSSIEEDAVKVGVFPGYPSIIRDVSAERAAGSFDSSALHAGDSLYSAANCGICSLLAISNGSAYAFSLPC
jgi:hypothetical protein